MNTVQLECFVTVAEYLNFSRASQKLKISQPAVSHQIQTLEEELTVKLFHRTSKSVSLTQEGLLFLADARLILQTAFSAKERLGSQNHFIPLELGCSNYMELNLFPPVLQILSRQYPLLRPNIRCVPFPTLFRMVENGQIQAAFGIKNEQKRPPLLFRELCSVSISCVCSPTHPLAQHKTLTKKQLEGNFIAIFSKYLPDFALAAQNEILSGLQPEQRFFTENMESAFVLAKAHLGYTLSLDIRPTRDRDLCYIPITDLPRISYGVFYVSSKEQPMLKQFLRLLSQYLNNCSI